MLDSEQLRIYSLHMSVPSPESDSSDHRNLPDRVPSESPYVSAINGFYSSHDTFIENFTTITKTANVLESEVTLDPQPMLDAFQELLLQIHQHEHGETLTRTMAGLVWAERKRRHIALNKLLQTPVQFGNAALGRFDEKGNSPEDSNIINDIAVGIIRHRESVDNDGHTLQVIVNTVEQDVRTFGNTVFWRYVNENVNSQELMTTKDVDHQQTQLSFGRLALWSGIAAGAAVIGYNLVRKFGQNRAA